MKKLILAALAVFFAMPAWAQSRQNCAPRAVVLERLASKYGETRQSIGMGSRGVVMELFASDETGTWTITVTTPDGLTCMIGAGNSYEEQNSEEPVGQAL